MSRDDICRVEHATDGGEIEFSDVVRPSGYGFNTKLICKKCQQSWIFGWLAKNSYPEEFKSYERFWTAYYVPAEGIVFRVQVDGRRIEIPELEELKLFFHRSWENRLNWYLSEESTGMPIVYGDTQKKALERLAFVMEKSGKDKILELIKSRTGDLGMYRMWRQQAKEGLQLGD